MTQPPYRSPADRVEDVEPLHRGPRDACPACAAQNQARCKFCQNDEPIRLDEEPGRHAKNKNGNLCWDRRTLVVRVTKAVYCAPGNRMRVGPWWWPVRCTDGNHDGASAHLHQRCLICGAKWICALAVPDGTRPLVLT